MVGIKKQRNTVLTTVNRIEQLKQIAYSKLGKILPVTKIFKILLVLTAFVVVCGFFATSISLSSKVLFQDQAVVNSLEQVSDNSFYKQWDRYMKAIEELEKEIAENKKLEITLKKNKERLRHKNQNVGTFRLLLSDSKKRAQLLSSENQKLVDENKMLEDKLLKAQADAALPLENKRLREAQEEFQKAKDVNEEFLNTRIQYLQDNNKILRASKNDHLQQAAKLQEGNTTLKNKIVELSDQMDSQQTSSQTLSGDLKKQIVRLTKLVKKQKNQLEDMNWKNTALIVSLSIVPLLIIVSAVTFVTYSVVKKKKKKKKKRS